MQKISSYTRVNNLGDVVLINIIIQKCLKAISKLCLF